MRQLAANGPGAKDEAPFRSFGQLPKRIGGQGVAVFESWDGGHEGLAPGGQNDRPGRAPGAIDLNGPGIDEGRGSLEHLHPEALVALCRILGFDGGNGAMHLSHDLGEIDLNT